MFMLVNVTFLHTFFKMFTILIKVWFADIFSAFCGLKLCHFSQSKNDWNDKILATFKGFICQQKLIKKKNEQCPKPINSMLICYLLVVLFSSGHFSARNQISYHCCGGLLVRVSFPARWLLIVSHHWALCTELTYTRGASYTSIFVASDPVTEWSRADLCVTGDNKVKL